MSEINTHTTATEIHNIIRDVQREERLAAQAEWDAMRAAISFEWFMGGGSNGAAPLYGVFFNDVCVGTVALGDDDLWHASDRDGEVVTAEVARIDAAAVLVDAWTATL